MGKLPFLDKPQKLAVESISATMRDLDQKLNAATKDPAAVSLAMMNNLRFVLAAVAEHDQLPNLLGSAWTEHQEKKLSKFRSDYFQSTWAPLVEAIAAGSAEAANVRLLRCCMGLKNHRYFHRLQHVASFVQARKDVVKEHCRRVNARIEKIFTTQCYFVLPDASLKSEVYRQIADEVIQPYTQFWKVFESMQLLKTPAKHFRYCCRFHQNYSGMQLVFLVTNNWSVVQTLT